MNNNKDILLINKPKNWTSNDVVQKVKHILKAKKVGHAGTLDPIATGLLILGINSGTKLLNKLIVLSKTYIAKIQFGFCTDTYDITGKILNKTNHFPTQQEIYDTLIALKQNYIQTVPIYSAVKQNGTKLYELARKNIQTTLPTRTVYINNFKILQYNNNILELEIDVSKGFYVRSLANDLGIMTNSLATLIELKRTKISDYLLSDAIDIKDVYDYWTKQ